MSKKHFEALAKALAESRGIALEAGYSADVVDMAALKVATVCASFNVNFDRARFLKACGVEV